MTAVAPEVRGADIDRAFVDLCQEVKQAGLLQPTYTYYLGRGLLSLALLGLSLAVAIGVPELGLVMAGAIAFASVQVGFVGHDAGHRAVFRSAARNAALGSLCWSLVLGIGFWYWNDRHLRHHSHVNDLQADPDLQWSGLVAYTEQAARTTRGQRLRRYQSLLGPCYALGLAFAFRVEGWNFTLRHLRGRRRRWELALLAASLVVWLAPLGVVGPGWLVTYVVAQMLGGLYLGAAIAPNHKGMPTWPAGARLGFVERQVLSSRNVRPGRLVDFVLGGLNYQIEHHLFPSMSRAHLGQARRLVRPFCAEHGLAYDERDALASYRIVLSELHRVGRSSAA